MDASLLISESGNPGQKLRGASGFSRAEMVKQRFVPTLVYVRETEDFHTRLCIYNYFSEIHPEIKTGATVHIWIFDTTGSPVADFHLPLGYKGQLQFEMSEVGRHFEGTAGVSLVPDTLPEIKHNRGVGTGYYVYYHDKKHHADYSHEWDPMKFEPSGSPPWICLVRPKLFPDTQLIVMSAYYGDDEKAGACRYTLRLRNGMGKILRESSMPALPPRGSTRFQLSDVFEDLGALAYKESVLSVEATGTNMQGPFTWVTHPRGDFNIHHFC